MKLELISDGNRTKTLKDIQIASNKLGFGSYSKFLEKCDHNQILTDINVNPLEKGKTFNTTPYYTNSNSYKEVSSN